LSIIALYRRSLFRYVFRIGKWLAKERQDRVRMNCFMDEIRSVVVKPEMVRKKWKYGVLAECT